MLIIYGCGGHARSVADVALANGVKELIFVDDCASPNEFILGFPVTREFSFSSHQIDSIIGIGDNLARSRLFEGMNDIISIIANDAYVSPHATITKGVFVGHNAYIGPNTIINENTIINTHCVVEHDCIVGKHSHISINATVAGKCKIGDFVMIGAGSTVIDGVNICSNVKVGAGSVVIKDITEPGTYVGVPVRKVI